ncbi:hypothetical protein CHS0354_033201 [Potamilus streckersoni]|uniref:Multiple inositol polyphosphate phosphatase 1 n=1 Tax=Potamilus streckersoni TaxID=2493646 RepID=A0AAE0VPS1_9BIVA|nr:hypothetical protein CHS0354_033201 [Potamilus streckersoni]
MKNIADVMTVVAMFLLVLSKSSPFVHATYNSYGDLTAYNWLYSANASVNVDQWTSFHLEGLNCSVIHVSAVIREGFPWPSIEDANRITLLYEKLKSSISSLDTSQYKFLKSSVNFYEHLANPDMFLFYRRIEDIALIADRFAKRLLFFLKSNNDELKFISSSKLKAIASTAEFRKQFTYTLTGVKANQTVNDLSDRLLRYYENCARVESIARSKEFLKEHYHFLNGSYFQNVKKAINQRLNLVNSKLDEGEVELLYLMCPYDRACFDRPEWCNILTDREKDIIGYFRDLKMYYTLGYGNSVIPSVACPLIQNIFRGMDESIEGRKGYSIHSLKHIYIATG